MRKLRHRIVSCVGCKDVPRGHYAATTPKNPNPLRRNHPELARSTEDLSRMLPIRLQAIQKTRPEKARVDLVLLPACIPRHALLEAESKLAG